MEGQKKPLEVPWQVVGLRMKKFIQNCILSRNVMESQQKSIGVPWQAVGLRDKKVGFFRENVEKVYKKAFPLEKEKCRRDSSYHRFSHFSF